VLQARRHRHHPHVLRQAGRHVARGGWPYLVRLRFNSWWSRRKPSLSMIELKEGLGHSH
jgi:hypothetical protein